MPPGKPAVVDCSCEMPRVFRVSGNGYLCVPTWDTRSPDPGGHGRSVAVTCALLVALGVVDDWKNAEKLIKEKRPYIWMNSLHRKALEEWSKNRLSPPKTGANTRN